MKTIILICALFGVTKVLCAQGGSSAKPLKPSLPTGALLQTAPNYSQWEVVFTYTDEQKQDKSTESKPKVLFTGAETRVRKVLTTKTGRILHEEYTNIAGRAWEIWFSDSNQYQKSGTATIWFESRPGQGGDGSYDPVPPSGFRKLDWIVPSNFAGTILNGNSSCLVFTPGGSQKLDLSDPAQQAAAIKAAPVVALIDAETRFPIVVRTQSEVRTYRFGPAPTQMQILPNDLATQIKQGDEGRARLYVPAPRPD